MKTKTLCMMIIAAMVFTLSINVFADCGSCEKQVKQKIEQKVEAKKEKDDEDIPLSQVPENIKKIAKKAVEGLKLTEAELEDGVYELKGYVEDRKYEVKITPKGKVVKIEKKDKKKKEKKDDDEDISLSQVPENIKKIAEKAVIGLKLTEAELEDGVYELKGYVKDQKYEVKITSKGKVVKIEKEEDDADDNEETFDD